MFLQEILERSLQEERMIDEMVEDEDVALSKGHGHWNKLFLRVLFVISFAVSLYENPSFHLS